MFTKSRFEQNCSKTLLPMTLQSLDTNLFYSPCIPQFFYFRYGKGKVVPTNAITTNGRLDAWRHSFFKLRTN